MPEEAHATGIEHLLAQSEMALAFLTPADRAGRWREAFGAAAPSVPEPVWLYGEDEQTRLVLGFPLRVTQSWDGFGRDLARLIEAEAVYRCALALEEPANKPALVEHRLTVARRLADLYENALLHDYDRRLPSILTLAVSREMARGVRGAARTIFTRAPKLPPRNQEAIRYTVAQRLADVTHRAEAEALARLRKQGSAEPRAEVLAFPHFVLQDLLPIAESQIGREMRELDTYLQGYLQVDPSRFHRVLATSASQLDMLRQRDRSFERVLAIRDPEAASLPSERLLFSPAALQLLSMWGHADCPRLSTDMLRLLEDLAARLRRFEVISALRHRIFPITERGARAVTTLQGQPVRLSAFTRPYDFTASGVVESSVRRYGLVYDLIEFTQLNEELRRRGRGAEDQALRFMVRFQAHLEEIRLRHRLTFEKFLGDGAFYSARNARGVLLAAAEARILYERMRHQGFPYDRGMRLAVNVGAYHLLPMGLGADDRPRFEFFGHGLVELARLTSGKTTQEVEDIADFLISSGYDVHRVLEFLEPVRQKSRFPEHVHDRPYAAFQSESGELVNHGGVVTEAFLRDLEHDWSGPLATAEHTNLRWLLLPFDPDRLEGVWIGLRPLGTPRLKGLEPTPLAEMVVFEQPPDGITMLPEGALLVMSLQELAAAPELAEAGGLALTGALDPALCVASTLDGEGRLWYVGLYMEEVDALMHAFSIPLSTVELLDGEPFEAWLFRRRGELAMLYQGLRRDSGGSAVPLETLRTRDGYFTCLLSAPHRSPR